MRKVTFLTLLVGVVALSSGILLAGHSDFPTLKKSKSNKHETKYDTKYDTSDIERGVFSLTKKDVDASLKGKVQHEWLMHDKIATLHASNDDQFRGFRTKACFDIDATYGRQTFGRSAADARIRLTNYGYWRYEGRYTPMTDRNTVKKLNADGAYTYGEKMYPKNMLTYLEECWVNMHLGTYFKAYDEWYSFEKHPVDVKIGYFPYKLGRGVALGDYWISLPYLGFDAEDYDDTRYSPPGILIHGTVNKNITYDLYYAKHSEKNPTPHESFMFPWQRIRANSTERHGNSFRRAWRGINKDRELWAARMDFTHQKRWGDLHVQPYMMYLDAPETAIEFEADSCARLGTVGAMMAYKRGRFKMNVECATQFGHQQVHAIDRNQQELYQAVDGTLMHRHTHVFGGDEVDDDDGVNVAKSEVKSPVNESTTVAAVNLSRNKGGWHDNPADTIQGVWTNPVTLNGKRLENAAGTAGLQSEEAGTTPDGGADSYDYIYNSNVTGNARFRDGYRVDYRGYMGMIDTKYTFEDTPVSIMAAAAFISGDKYPYNTEKNKRYRGFITCGDYNYMGKYVISHMILDARKLPRPINLSLHHRYAFNNTKDMSNLAYLGLGAKWKPFKNKKKLKLRTNLIWFWEATTLSTWDKDKPFTVRNGSKYQNTDCCSGETEFVGDVSWKADTSTHHWISGDGATADCHGTYKVGWMSCEPASRSLGTEVNFEAKYKPVKNCRLTCMVGCFIPGQLYKDLDGQPNVATRNGPKAVDEGVFGLGHDLVWRFVGGLDYRF